MMKENKKQENFFTKLLNKIKHYFGKENKTQRINHLNTIKKKILGTQGTDGFIMKVVIYALLIIIGFIFLYPLIMMNLLLFLMLL